jgi:hypothetical protein
MSQDKKLYWLEWFQANPSIFATVALPILLAFIGWIFTAAQNEAANNLKYVEIAINILEAKPSESKVDLREWAIDILSKHATVPLSEKAKAVLRKESVTSHVLQTNAIGGSTGTADLMVNGGSSFVESRGTRTFELINKELKK